MQRLYPEIDRHGEEKVEGERNHEEQQEGRKERKEKEEEEKGKRGEENGSSRCDSYAVANDRSESHSKMGDVDSQRSSSHFEGRMNRMAALKAKL